MAGFSVHDGDIIPMVTSLGLFPDAEDLPTDRLVKDRRWKTSQITPMGGRVTFELLDCSSGSAVSPPPDGDRNRYVRVNVNDGIVRIPSCSIGASGACPLSHFERVVRKKGSQFGDFRDVCGLDGDANDRITFLHQ